MTDDPSTQSQPPQQLALFWQVLGRLPRYLRMSMALVRDNRVPAAAKAALAFGGVYAISPVDAIPGVIPVAGQLDDLVVALLAIRGALALCPDHVVADYLARYGLAEPGIDADLKTTFATVRWLSAKTLRGIRRLAVREGRMLLHTSKRVAGKLEERLRPTQHTGPPGPA